MLETIDLEDGGIVHYAARFFPNDEADALLACLNQTTAWQQEIARGRPFPRLTAWVADQGVDYRYSGVVHMGRGWTPALDGIRKRIETAAGTTFNSVLLNRYRHGQDSIGMHADDEPELGTNPVVASVSLGAVRTFVLRHKTSRAKHSFALSHGSLLVMAGTTQHHWLHGLPKTKVQVGERINLTFRRIVLP